MIYIFWWYIFIAPKFSYQIFITRTYAKELDSFYTTSFAILKNKEQETYKILFKKLKKKKMLIRVTIIL